MITHGPARRARRIRAKIKGTEARPRLSVFRSLRGMFVQLIDDTKGVTLVGVRTSGKSNAARALGKELARIAQEKKITSVVFDKGSYRYHGRVKALAEGAREGGLIF